MISLTGRMLPLLALVALSSSPALNGQVAMPTLPENDPKWDWIRLDSGECIKGELRVMYEDVLEFDSDHFGIIQIDWDDIVEIRSSRQQSVRTNSRTSMVGKLVMVNNEVRVVSDNKTETLPRRQVVSIASGQPKESNYWTIKASLGANVRSGNVEQVDYSSRATIQRRTATTRLYWDYIGNYSTSQDVEIASTHRSNSYFDYFFSRRFFVRPLSAEYYRDPFQNIAHRQTYSASLGYTVVDGDKLTIDVTGGPAWQRIEYKNVGEGDEAIRDSMGGILTTTVNWELNKRTDFIGTYRVQWVGDEAGGITGHFDSTFEIELTRKIDLNFSFIWDRISNPVANDLGEIPDKDDFRLVLGFGLDM